MRGRILLLGITALAAVTACGGSTPARVAHPTPVSERGAEKPHGEPPRLIAPPPAYGNKIVMARGPRSATVN